MRNIMFVVLVLLPTAANAWAQQFSIVMQNQMQTPSRLLITPVGSTTTTELRLNKGRPVTFNFSSERFNIQVIPDDEPNSGFPFIDVDLQTLSRRANGQAVTFNGAFAPSEKVLVCVKRRCRSRRCRCCWVMKRRERVAVGMEAHLNDGTTFFREVKKMPYSQPSGY